MRYFKILCVVLFASFLVACEVTAEEYKHYEIGNTFIQDAALENEEGEEND